MNSNEYKVLNVMNTIDKAIFFRDLSKKSNVSIGGTQQVLKNYSKFIDKNIEGRNTYYSLKNNLEGFYLKLLIEIRKTQIFIEDNSKFREFFSYFIKKNIPAIVFGSYAKNKFSKASDIDILVLSKNKIPEHLCPVEIHLINLTKSQFETAVKKKEILIKEIRNNHIIINGGDYFINILKNE
jgi:predicted nucleotidyltransferase